MPPLLQGRHFLLLTGKKAKAPLSNRQVLYLYLDGVGEGKYEK